MLKSSLVKYVKHDVPSTSSQRRKMSISLKEVHEGWVYLLEKWHNDLSIVKLLVNALLKTLDFDCFGAVLAKELTQHGRDESFIFELLQHHFTAENADCELRLSLVNLWSSILKMAPIADEDQGWKKIFVKMLLSFLDQSGDMANVAQDCFRALNQMLMMDKKEKSENVILTEENQEMMLKIYQSHANTGKQKF